MVSVRSFGKSFAALAVLACSTVAAHAGSVSGSAYCNIASPSGASAQGSQYATSGVTLSTLSAAEASGSLCAGFSSNVISYNAGYGNSNTTLLQFLSSTAGNTTFTQTPSATQSALGTLLVLTGSTYLTNGQQYNLSHDDGANLYIGMGTMMPTTLLVGEGAQTVAGQAPFTFTGTSGAYNYELLYVSNYQAPSELISDISTGTAATPEPSSLLLLGTGLAGVGAAIRRRVRL